MFDNTTRSLAGLPPMGKVGRELSDLGIECQILKTLKIVDRQDAVNRYSWYNLYPGLTVDIIERVIYYRGQGILFYLPGDDGRPVFYFLPYALSGSIDVYGRYKRVTPLPFNGTSSQKDEKAWIQGLEFEPVYEVILPEEFEDKSIEELENKIRRSCVILRDYTEGIAQYIEPRVDINRPILEIMSDCFPFMRTALLNSTGIEGMRVPTEDQMTNVFAANSAAVRAAREGSSKIPFVGDIKLETFTGGSTARAEEFLLAMQSLDNYRLSLYGLDNGGIFQKKSHKLEAEQEMNSGNVGLIGKDGLDLRRNFCMIANSIFGGDMWVEPSEVTLGVDYTGDGLAADGEMTAQARASEGGASDE